METENDTILSITNMTDGSILPDDAYAYYYTIPGLFELLQNVLDTKEHLRNLEFNKTYSYPSALSVDQLVLAIDDEYGYTISNLVSLNKVQIIPVASNTQQGDGFALKTAKITGDIITLTLEFSGGCIDHDIALFASDAFLESYPPPGRLLYPS